MPRGTSAGVTPASSVTAITRSVDEGFFASRPFTSRSTSRAHCAGPETSQPCAPEANHASTGKRGLPASESGTLQRVGGRSTRPLASAARPAASSSEVSITNAAVFTLWRTSASPSIATSRSVRSPITKAVVFGIREALGAARSSTGTPLCSLQALARSALRRS